MNFVVTYRDPKGEKVEGEFVAADRKELFATLEAKGISAISVREGTLGAGRKKASAGGAGPSAFKGVVALILVLLIGIVVWFFVSAPKARKPEKKVENKKPAQIVEVEPVKVEAQEDLEEPPKTIDPNARPTKIGEEVNGYVLLPSGRLHKRQGVVTNSISSRPKGKHEIFDNRCDNEIAGLLALQPGDMIIGTPRYNGKFKERFLKSLETPIIVTKDDTPEQAELKRNVIEAKIAMKEALDRGEDIEQIMLDARRDAQELARYKHEIQMQFHELRKQEGNTEQDVMDIYDACNSMLEKKGIAPIKYGPITKQKMKMLKEGAE